jgi:hypothetical protein
MGLTDHAAWKHDKLALCQQMVNLFGSVSPHFAT